MRTLILTAALAACNTGSLKIGETAARDSGVGDTESDTDTDADGDTDADADADSDTDADTDADTDTDTDTGVTDTDTGPPPEAPDYTAAGGYPVDQQDGEEELASCDMGFDHYIPVGAGDAPVVILAHGFERGRENMAGWAEHLATWGVEVYAVDLCHASAWDTDHEQNGRDLAELANRLGVASPVYMGHSAGGLAAILAGSEDPGAAGIVGLDPVDADNLGTSAAPSVKSPVLGLIGEPSFCNAEANGAGMYGAAPNDTLWRVTDGDHCDFEDPSDWLCELACTGGNDSFSDDEIQTTLAAMLTAGALWTSGADPLAAQWWVPGNPWNDAWTDAGALEAP